MPHSGNDLFKKFVNPPNERAKFQETSQSLQDHLYFITDNSLI